MVLGLNDGAVKYLIGRASYKERGNKALTYFESRRTAGSVYAYLNMLYPSVVHEHYGLLRTEAVVAFTKERYEKFEVEGGKIPWAELVGNAMEYMSLVWFGCVNCKWTLPAVYSVIQRCVDYDEALEALMAASDAENAIGGVKPDAGIEQRARKRKSGDVDLCGMPVKRAKTVVDDGEGEKYKWSGLKDYGGRKAVGSSLMEDMKVIILDEDEYRKFESVLIGIDGGLRSQNSIDWTSAGWTKNNLLKNGFTVESGPVMVVCCGVIKLLFVPSKYKMESLDDLLKEVQEHVSEAGNYTKHVKRLGTVKRGGKPSTGHMMMAGSHAFSRPHHQQQRENYMESAESDPVLNGKIQKAADAMMEQEREDVPAIAFYRNEVVAHSDEGNCRAIVSLSGEESIYSMSMTWGYTAGPHVDLGSVQGLTESIFFSKSELKLLEGHEWNFVGPGVICRLDGSPSCRVYIPSDVWHGTLPTHPNGEYAEELHGGVGSAIVVRKDMVTLGSSEM